MRRVNLLLILIMTIFICSQSNAEPNQNMFGYINVTEVMQLHPMMRYFDSSSRRFQLESKLKGDDIKERVEKNKIKHRADLNKLEEKVKELENKRKELEETYLEKVEHMSESEKNYDNMTEKEKEKYNQKRAEFENEFYNQADEIRKKLYYLEEEIKNKEKSSEYTGYLSQGESAQIFTLMLDDVYEALEVVSKKKNCAFVFNSSAHLEYNSSASNTPNYLPTFFNEFHKKSTDPEMNDSEKKTIAAGQLAMWLSSRNSSFSDFNDRRMSAFVMKGGIDLTPDVVDYIYEKHKIGKEQREFIKEFFKKIASKEFENF